MIMPKPLFYIITVCGLDCILAHVRHLYKWAAPAGEILRINVRLGTVKVDDIGVGITFVIRLGVEDLRQLPSPDVGLVELVVSCLHALAKQLE